MLCEMKGCYLRYAPSLLFRKQPSLAGQLSVATGNMSLIRTEGLFITVSRVTLAEAKKQLSYIIERARSKDKKFM